MHPYGKKHNEQFGPNGDSVINKDLNFRINYNFEKDCEYLRSGRMLIFMTASDFPYGLNRAIVSSTKINDFCNIILSDYSKEKKVELLGGIILLSEYSRKIIDTFKDKASIIKILEQTSDNINTKGTGVEDKTVIDQHSTPNNQSLMVWCSNIGDGEFFPFVGVVTNK